LADSAISGRAAWRQIDEVFVWFLDPLRDDPRFHALLRKMKLDA
jgi:hypothetical protein